MGLSGFTKPDLDFRRERQIQITSPTPGEEDPVQILQSTPKEVNAASGDVVDKAQELLDELKRLLKDLPIPVSDKAPDVRAAVRRLDKTSDGTHISYDLYQSLKMGAFERVNSLNLREFASHLTGHAPTDARSWTSFRSRTGDPEPLFGSEFADMALHMALLIGLNQLLGIADSADKAASTLTPNPGSIVIQAAVGIASLKALHGVGEEDKDAVLSSFGPNTRQVLDDRLNSAGVDFSSSDTGDLLNIFDLYLRPGDESLVYDYAQGFLSRTSDVNYLGWRVADKAMDAFWRQKSLHGSPTLERFRNGENPDFPQDVWCLSIQEATSDAARLDDLAAVMSVWYDSGAICCVTRWLGSIGSASISDLEGIRDWLSISSAFVTSKLSSRLSLGPQLYDFFRRRVLFTMLDSLDSFISSSGGRFLDWASESSSTWERLFRCPPIEDFINQVVQGVAFATELAKDWVSEMFEAYQVSEFQWAADSQLFAESGTTQTLIFILDMVIGSLRDGQMCSFGEDRLPDAKQVLRIADQNFGPDSIPVVSKGDNRFRHYQPVSLKTRDGRVMPTSNTTFERRQSQDVIDECLRKLSAEDIIDIPGLESELEKEIRNAKARIGL